MARDYTKYSVDNETFVGKGKLARLVLEKWIIANGHGTLAQLQEIFKDEVQGSNFLRSKEDVENNYDRKRFDPTEVPCDDQVVLVSNQWGSLNINNLLKLCENIGIKVYTESDSIISNENSNKSVDNKIKVEIEIFGRMHQILNSGINNINESDIDADILYENVVAVYYKIDTDNFMRIILNDSTVQSFELSDLNLKIDNSWIPVHSEGEITEFGKKINLKSDLSYVSWYEEKYDESHFMEVYYSEKENLFSGYWPGDFRMNEDDYPSLDQRYSIVQYGKFVLRSEPVYMNSFSLKDLVFVRDSNVSGFIQSSFEEYSFSKLLFMNNDELNLPKFEVIESNIKSVEILKGWSQDF